MKAGKVTATVAAGVILGSAAVVGFIRKWEDGPNPHVVYADKLAGGLPTACGGLTKHVTDTPIVVGDRWSDEKCDREIARALVKVQTELLRCFRVTPPQDVFDAATSHAWNFGAGATCGSSAMRAWNAGQWALGCRRLALDDTGRPIWSYVKTGRTLPDGRPEYRFVQGLANRRQAERNWCMQGVIP